MERPKPMDRLVCGDVGYGKTEVAMRAAFEAVMDNKQVAVVVPTTLLAQQHYQTFSKRFAPFPVRVEVLSRFRSRKEQKAILEDLKTGAVDILIGTHRLLQKDIQFRDLGLVVIDEEHRFGVRHKEKLKQLRKQIDVLTLTATPIPRTLQMALAQVRDLSVIETPRRPAGDPDDPCSIRSDDHPGGNLPRAGPGRTGLLRPQSGPQHRADREIPHRAGAGSSDRRRARPDAGACP
ncbi:MAG: DEAD/DEAH box helicase [Candidatus Manganitrophus sp.]|nr:DEAD/DEAH box helicase [Candidatus Manganitrophus sp.]WDT70489.1 MAG: DEAD/DEAH box helicase [Candidatus Manganitrophus sp.]